MNGVIHSRVKENNQHNKNLTNKFRLVKNQKANLQLVKILHNKKIKINSLGNNNKLKLKKKKQQWW